MDCSPIINVRMSGVTAMRRRRGMHATDIYRYTLTATPRYAPKRVYQKENLNTGSRAFSGTKTSIIEGIR